MQRTDLVFWHLPTNALRTQPEPSTEEHYVDRCAEIVSARDRGAQGESNG